MKIFLMLICCWMHAYAEDINIHVNGDTYIITDTKDYFLDETTDFYITSTSTIGHDNRALIHIEPKSTLFATFESAWNGLYLHLNDNGYKRSYLISDFNDTTMPIGCIIDIPNIVNRSGYRDIWRQHSLFISMERAPCF